MLKKILPVFLLIFLGISLPFITNATPDVPSSTALSTREDPIAFLTKITDKVLASLKKNKTQIKTDPKLLQQIAEDLILPHVDFDEMSRWVAGKKAWDKSSPEQQQKFIAEFKTLVLRTYINALQQYTNEKIEFLPLQGAMRKTDNAKRIQVSSRIRKTNGQIVQVNYRLISKDNSWQVYDIIIEGVSVLKGFQAQFSEQIRQKGLLDVTEQIKQHNLEKVNT